MSPLGQGFLWPIRCFAGQWEGEAAASCDWVLHFWSEDGSAGASPSRIEDPAAVPWLIGTPEHIVNYLTVFPG